LKTVRMLGNKQSEVIETPDPEPVDDLVVVKVMSSAVCGTEHKAYYADKPTPVHGGIGHEAAGVVWKTGKAAQRVKEGDRITVYPTVFENCLSCPSCAAGKWQLCQYPRPKRSSMGTHTQYMLVPEYLCLPILDDISFETGSMIDDCVGTPYRAIKRLNVKAGETVLITGAGPVGAAASVISKFFNARVIVADINGYRLEQTAKNGADHTIDSSKNGVLERIKEINPKGIDVAIECSGAETAQQECLDAVKAGGRVAFLGLKADVIPVHMARHFLFKELTLIGSWACTVPEHYEIIDLITSGMPIERIITHRYEMDKAQEAFSSFFSGQAVKAVIQPWGA
jgi:threonine dehydrogenase-like Zn-dependent dehydrogenase